MANVRRAAGALLVGAVALTGCGDAPTDDRRGYTKAPLEEPGAFISPEPMTAMDALGEPDRLALPRRAAEDEAESDEGEAGND